VQSRLFWGREMFFWKCSPGGLYGESGGEGGGRTYRWELVTRCAYHADVTYLSSPTEIEHCEGNDPDFLVGAGLATAYIAGGVFAGLDPLFGIIM